MFSLLHCQGGLIAILVAAQIQNELDGIILDAASIDISSDLVGPVEVSMCNNCYIIQISENVAALSL